MLVKSEIQIYFDCGIDIKAARDEMTQSVIVQGRVYTYH